MCQNLCNEHELERVLPKASRVAQRTAKHESVVVVADNGLSDLWIGIICNEAHDSHDDHDENHGWNDQDDPRMSHHLSIQPHRRCVRTVLSPCQGYMSTVNLFESFGESNSDQILSRIDSATIQASSCACKSSLVTQSLISESSLSISGCFLRNLMKVSVYPWMKLEAGSHLSSS